MTYLFSKITSTALYPAQGANTEPLGDRIVNHVGKTAGTKSAKKWNPAETCSFCKIVGHNIHDCRKLATLKAETPQSQGVSFSTDAYLSACAVHEADACLSSLSPATHAGIDASHLSDILAGIGPPKPCNAMPDPAAVNTGFAVDPMGYVNALSSKGPKMMFNHSCTGAANFDFGFVGARTRCAHRAGARTGASIRQQSITN